MTAAGTAGPRRFVALDVFRGATIILMILVNTAGPGASAYSQLVHARWIGFTLADLVYPTFLFAMGNAMAFALQKPLDTQTYIARLAKRCCVIFALGYLMYWFPFVVHGDTGWALKPFAETRLPGVLQRIALCYFLAGLLVRWIPPRQIIVASIIMLIGYWIILLEFSAPGMAYDKFGNAGTRLDLALLGPEHLYKKDGGFDPEGLLGTLPATVNVLAGYLAGLAILNAKKLSRTAILMVIAGGVLVCAGMAWSPWFPLAKKLWTGSYVLVTIGLDLAILAGAVALIEIAKVRKGARIFTIVGRNPLAIYLFSELFVVVLNMIPAGSAGGVYDWIGIALFQTIAPGPLGSLLCAITYTFVCWCVGWWMDRRGLILKA